MGDVASPLIEAHADLKPPVTHWVPRAIVPGVRIDIRWATTDPANLRTQAADLAALAPDVLVAATGTVTVAPLLQATRTVPIVFIQVIDPVGAGFVVSLARPGGNATGFTIYEYGMMGT